MKYTPGPWKLNGDTITGIDAQGMEGPIAQVSHFWRNREIDHTNAQLIAAVPEMLEALKAVLEEWHNDDRNFERAEPQSLALVRQVIAKAEEETI